MREYTFSKHFIDRYESFLSSYIYTEIDDYSKSDYWEYHSDAVDISVSNTKIVVGGKSGFYVPHPKDPIQSVKSEAGNNNLHR